MKVNRSSNSGGAWLNKETIQNGDQLKIVTEAQLVEGQNGAQLVAKVRERGGSDSVNVSINNTTKNALIEAYGDDTKDWVNKIVTAAKERAVIAGKRSTILYLIPEDYELQEGADGFMTITRSAVQVAPTSVKARRTKKEEVIEEDADEDLRDAPDPEDPGEDIEVPW